MSSYMSLMTPCPTCKKEIVYRTDNPFRPFCSKRCKLIDLGTWLEEGYSIPAGESTEKPENFDTPVIGEQDG
jgi:endogenous inhibitor of DNA gyrase (YacG/DUF329 family)